MVIKISGLSFGDYLLCIFLSGCFKWLKITCLIFNCSDQSKTQALDDLDRLAAAYEIPV